MLGMPGAAAQEPDDDAEPADVSREGYYTAPAHEALPAILTSEVPPGIFCIVVPEFCSEDAEQLTEPIEGALDSLREATPPEPVQLVAPDSLPVSLLGGKPRHMSYLEFTVPPADGDVLVEQFDLVLTEETPPYGFESPAFRAAVRAMINQVADGFSPDPFAQVIADVAAGEEDVVIPEITGVEVCPVLETWEEGENQDAREQPDRDCAFGANGVRDDDGTWTFDLAFAAQGWIDGDLPVEGVYIGPVGPENVEYGDPDPSANFSLAFAGADADEDAQPALRVVYGAAPEPLPPLEDAGTATTAPASEPASDPAPAPASSAPRGGTSTAPFDSGAVEDVADEPAPEVAQGPAETEAESPPPPPEFEPTGAAADPAIPAHLWLLLPLGATTALAFTRALGATPVPGAVSGQGALSNLVSQDSTSMGNRR